MLNQHSEEIDGKKYADYKLNYFVKKYIENTDLTDTLKTNLDRLGKDTIYHISILPYKIKDEVMQYLINCGTWKFTHTNPYTLKIHRIPLTSSNYNRLNKEYLKHTDTITDISYQKKLNDEDEFEQIFFYQDGKSSKRKRQISKRRQSSKRKSKKRQSSKRKSRKRQSSKRKSKRKSFFK